jgi:hypothetical protein
MFYVFTTSGFYHMVYYLSTQAPYTYLPLLRHNNIDLSFNLLLSVMSPFCHGTCNISAKNRLYLFNTTSRLMTFEAYETFPFYLWTHLLRHCRHQPGVTLGMDEIFRFNEFKCFVPCNGAACFHESRRFQERSPPKVRSIRRCQCAWPDRCACRTLASRAAVDMSTNVGNDRSSPSLSSGISHSARPRAEQKGTFGRTPLRSHRWNRRRRMMIHASHDRIDDACWISATLLSGDCDADGLVLSQRSTCS